MFEAQLHEKLVFVPADKAGNNVFIVCKRYYIETLIKELGMITLHQITLPINHVIFLLIPLSTLTNYLSLQ